MQSRLKGKFKGEGLRFPRNSLRRAICFEVRSRHPSHLFVAVALTLVTALATNCKAGKPMLFDRDLARPVVEMNEGQDGPYTYITRARDFDVTLPQDGERKWKLTITHVSTIQHGCATIELFLPGEESAITIKPNGSDGIWMNWTNIDIGFANRYRVKIGHTQSGINIFTFSQ